MLSVTQLSDLHVARPGERGYGGLGPDTGESFAAVIEHAFGGAQGSTITVVTGDVADHGLAEEYEIAAERLATIPTPITIVPGNHDFHAPFQVRLPAKSISMNRAETHGRWLFLYLDSNADGRRLDATGRLVDNDDRIRANGTLGPAEVAWVDELVSASSADHVWLWVHHAPGASGMFVQPTFRAEIEGLIERHPRIRGLGAGHTHTNEQPTIADRPVHICPSLTLNFDVEAWTTLPPGYRRYVFHDDGTVESELRWLDDQRWPRLPLPDPVVHLLQGDITWEEMQARMDLDLSH